MTQNTFFRNIQRRTTRLLPSSKLGRFTLYVFTLRMLVIVAQQSLLYFSSKSLADMFDGWGAFFTFILTICFTILALRWFRSRFLWKVRNRLIVTYLFIGVVPVGLVVLMASISGYLFFNQYATSQARGEIESEVKRLEVVNNGLANELSERLEKGGTIDSHYVENFSNFRHQSRRFPGWQIILWQEGKYRWLHGNGPQTRDTEEPKWDKGGYQGIVVDEGKLYLRAVAAVKHDDHEDHLVSSLPLTSEMLDKVAAGLGAIQIFIPQQNAKGKANSSAIKISATDNTGTKSTQQDFIINGKADASGGQVPESKRGRWDLELTYATLYPYTDLTSKQTSAAVLQVRTRPGVLLDRLFAETGFIAVAIQGALVGIAVFFALIVLVASFFGFGLMRTISSSVYNLYEATQYVNRGDFQHRIKVKSKDQLAALQTSFNQMSESIERLIVEQKEKERLENELAIAKEVQATLFPRASHEMSTIEIHGLCKPARTVSGDYYDLLPCGDERLGLAVGDISGKGISAALLMATIHSAVRVYEYGNMPGRKELVRAGAAAMAGAALVVDDNDGAAKLSTASNLESPALVMELLNRHVYNSTPVEKYATLFLGIYDGKKRVLTYCNAGHLPPLVIGNDGSFRRLDTSGMVIGLFDNVQWEESRIQLSPGDIFVAYSDGVTEPENEFGEFGEERLIEVIRDNRHLALERISEAVFNAVADWIGANEQPDDVTLVLARAR